MIGKTDKIKNRRLEHDAIRRVYNKTEHSKMFEIRIDEETPMMHQARIYDSAIVELLHQELFSGLAGDDIPGYLNEIIECDAASWLWDRVSELSWTEMDDLDIEYNEFHEGHKGRKSGSFNWKDSELVEGSRFQDGVARWCYGEEDTSYRLTLFVAANYFRMIVEELEGKTQHGYSVSQEAVDKVGVMINKLMSEIRNAA